MSTLTERALANSLKKLLEKKTLDKITVKDITQDCGVNRQTFYYHFHDVYDLVEWIFLEESRRFLKSGISRENWSDIVTAVMDHIRENKALTMNTYYSLTRTELDRSLGSIIYPVSFSMVKEAAEGRHVTEEDVNLAAGIITKSLISVVLQWIEEGMPDGYRRQTARLSVMMEGALDLMVDNFERAYLGGKSL